MVVNEREFSLAVVGIDFPNPDKSKSNRRFEIALCAPGDPVELRREPRNKHDERAVGVFSERGIQLGYLNAERAAWLTGKLAADEIYEAIFQQAEPAIAVIRVRFGGGSPTLPQPRPPGRGEFDPERDFEPDPEPPVWGA